MVVQLVALANPVQSTLIFSRMKTVVSLSTAGHVFLINKMKVAEPEASYFLFNVLFLPY